jgi:hypothetical protein
LKLVLGTAITMMIALGAASAFAKGHVAGAAVGTVVAPKHHRVAGAVVGGAVGHHMAKAKAAKKAATPASK